MSNSETDRSGLIERICNLEIRVAHQDRTIDDLNEMVAKQWIAIEQLNQQYFRLKDRLVAVESSSKVSKPEDEPPPPHY